MYMYQGTSSSGNFKFKIPLRLFLATSCVIQTWGIAYLNFVSDASGGFRLNYLPFFERFEHILLCPKDPEVLWCFGQSLATRLIVLQKVCGSIIRFVSNYTYVREKSIKVLEKYKSVYIYFRNFKKTSVGGV